MSFLSEFRSVLAIAVVALAAPVLQGCVGTVVGAGATRLLVLSPYAHVP